jgi:hypothetical protein
MDSGRIKKNDGEGECYYDILSKLFKMSQYIQSTIEIKKWKK